MAIITSELSKILCEAFGEKQIQLKQQSGGCINQCFKIETDNKKFFCKVNSVSNLPHLFEVEAKGLELLRSSKIFKTPEVIKNFYIDDYQILILEWVEEGDKTTFFWKKFGSALAELHSITSNKFGLDINNYMGSVLQINIQHTDWISFLIEQRLHPLMIACKEMKLLTSFHEHLFQNFFTKLPDYFKNVKPSLVHGDLWSGNFMCDKYGEPVLIDPAVYYGIPAVDIGMTKLFGGFNALFYESYQYQAGNLPEEQQNKICNIYPLLIHLFLFGKTYLPQIEETIKNFK